MKKLCFFLIVFFFAAFTPFPSQSAERGELLLADMSTQTLSRRYLREARSYRAKGRYELARQHYLLSLSICDNPRQIAEIRKELDGIELLLRTMR